MAGFVYEGQVFDNICFVVEEIMEEIMIYFTCKISLSVYTLFTLFFTCFYKTAGILPNFKSIRMPRRCEAESGDVL